MTDIQFETKYRSDMEAVIELQRAINLESARDIRYPALNNELRRLKLKINRACKYYDLPLRYKEIEPLFYYI